MSGSAAPFRIVFQRSDGQRLYFDREVESRDQFNIARSQPHFGEEARHAKRFNTPTEAIGRRDVFRTTWPRERFFIESCSGDSEALFENRSNDVARTPAPTERQNYQADGILIVAGQSSGYYVRFPGSAFESIRGESADEAYAKYREQVALRPQLAQYVEKYPGLRRPGNER